MRRWEKERVRKWEDGKMGKREGEKVRRLVRRL